VCVLNKLRAKFKKGPNVKFISHLDTLRTFERALRRSMLPVSYSQGYNPRQQMTFGLPISVGVTSDSEYVEFNLDNKISPDKFIKILNENMPEGFMLLDAEYIESTQSLMASICFAEYEIQIDGYLHLEKVIDNFLKSQSILTKTERKGKIKEIDIRPDIHVLRLIDLDILYMKLSAGSNANLKPELVIKALNEMFELNLKIVKVHRIGLLGEGSKALL
jgi:radical SAM-linked protein